MAIFVIKNTRKSYFFWGWGVQQIKGISIHFNLESQFLRAQSRNELQFKFYETFWRSDDRLVDWNALHSTLVVSLLFEPNSWKGPNENKGTRRRESYLTGSQRRVG